MITPLVQKTYRIKKDHDKLVKKISKKLKISDSAVVRNAIEHLGKAVITTEK